eukprot:2696917-Alexandrium_andersonii.AAC.1
MLHAPQAERIADWGWIAALTSIGRTVDCTSGSSPCKDPSIRAFALRHTWASGAVASDRAR